MTEAVLRRATADDLDAIDDVVREAYRKYVARIGRENLTFYPKHGYVETHRGREDGYDRVY